MKKNKLGLSLLVMSCLWLICGSALATSTGGSDLPWDTMLTKIANELTGSVAHLVVIISIAATGIGFAISGAHPIVHKGLGIACAACLGVFAFQVAQWLGISGALL